MSNKPILVVGATGKTGRRVAERLTARGLQVRGASRSSETRFDWEDPATWAPAVQGVDQAYVTYYPDLTFNGAPERIREFSGVAVRNGVKHLVLLSGRNEAGALRSEQAMQESGVDWTVVRSSFMNQNFNEGFWVDSVLAGEIAAPAGDVTDPWIDADDIADVATAALTDERHRNKVYEVTGPRLLSFYDVADEISTATGREIRYIPVSHDEFRAGMIAEGVPEDLATNLSELFKEVLDGRSSYLSHGVREALGREPKDFGDYAREAAATGVWDAAAVAGTR